jgi:butyryl-CoA dehydrogenase
MKSFDNKIVVITGAGSGMGRAYAIEFARLGAKLAITDYDAQGLAGTQAFLDHLPHKGMYSETLDISDKAAVYGFANAVKTELGGAHVLINNAGIGGGGMPVWQMSPEQITQTMNVNFFGVVHGTQAFLPQLIKNNEGAIVNVSSVFGLIGTPNASDYCASKFAVRGYSESLMVELESSPISVHLVHPGGVKTNIAKETEGGSEFEKKYLKTPPEYIARLVIEGIKQGQQRIVCGHQSKSISLLSWLLPLKWRNKYLYREMKDLLNQDHYEALNRSA